MARGDLGSPRQPSLADEIAELEEREKVTKALQAAESEHGMSKHGIVYSPKGPTPQKKGVSKTPKKTKTPSPIKTYPDGTSWTLEDGAESEEERQESDQDEDGEGQNRSSTVAGACASSGDAEGTAQPTAPVSYTHLTLPTICSV